MTSSMASSSLSPATQVHSRSLNSFILVSYVSDLYLFFFFGVAWFEQKLFVGDVSCDVCEANESSDGEKGEDWSENCLSSDEYTS